MEEFERMSIEVAIRILRAHANSSESEDAEGVAAAQQVVSAAAGSGVRAVWTGRGFYFLPQNPAQSDDTDTQ